MPPPDDEATEPTSPAAAELTATEPAEQQFSPHSSDGSLLTATLSPSAHSPPSSLLANSFVRCRPRLHTALRLSASSASTYPTSAPHTATTHHYTLNPPTVSLSTSTLTHPSLPTHPTTALDTFTFHHLYPPLDPPRTVHRRLIGPLLDGIVDGGGGVVVVCYGEEERAKAELLMGREAGAGVVVQAMGALLQSIRQREQTATVNGKAEVVQAEEKREAEEDEQQQQRTSPPSHPTNPPRRRKHRLNLSALRLTHCTLTDLLSPTTAVSVAAISTAVSTVEVNGWTEHRVREAADCVRLLLRAEKLNAVAATADGDGHVLYRVGVQSRWRRNGSDGSGGSGGSKGDGYRYASLTFVKLAARCLSSTSPLSSPSASASSTTLPFSPHWVNKDILALTRVLSCLLTPANHTTPASPHHPPTHHVPYRSSLLTATLSSTLEQCSELVLLFGLTERTDGRGSGGWQDGREEWRFVEEFGGVVRGRRQAEEGARRRRRWRGENVDDDEKDSDDEVDERVLTVLEYYKAECAKRTAALSTPPPPPRPTSPPPQPLVTQPSRPPTPPPTVPRPTTTADEQKEANHPSPSDQLSTDSLSAADVRRQKEVEEVAALKKRQQEEKEAMNRAAILLARQQQQQRDLDRELRALAPLLTALGLPARKVSSAAQLAAVKGEVERLVRQRVCGGVSVWKWSKKAVGGEVKRRECEVRWDEVAVGVVWEGRKRWRQVTKCVRRSEVERVVVGGGVSGGVLEEWKARMRALVEQKADSGSSVGGSEVSEVQRAEMRRQFRCIDRWSISVVSGGRVLDVVCDSEESHVVLLEGLKRLLGETVKVEDRRPGNGGMKVRDVKV